MRHVLVTGGFGFIGGHLIELLLRDPDVELHVVDNLSTSPCPLDYLLDKIGRPKQLTFDICDMAEFFQETRADYDEIYHLASPVGPAGVLTHGGEMVRQVVADGYLVIDYCLDRGARLLDVSTSEVYGGGQEGFCTEAAPKIIPAEVTIRLEYAIAKLAVETALINSHRVRGLRTTIVRPFNVAGPRQSPTGGFVLPRFIRQAQAGQPLTVFGDGKALRAFTHVKDLAAGIQLAMRFGKDGEAYNLGNPENKISIEQLADRVITALDSKSSKEFVDPQSIYGPLYTEANDKFPDATMAMQELSWRPLYSVDDVIRDAYADLQDQQSSGVAV